MRYRQALAICAGLFLSGDASIAQVAESRAANVLRFDTATSILRVQGKTVEVVGLSRWTPAMIQDSMNLYAPGESLLSHGCAAVLRYKLRFAQALSAGLRQPDGQEYNFIAVIEPQDSVFVRHRELPMDTVASTASWTPLVDLARTNPALLELGVIARLRAHGLGLPPVVPSELRADSAKMHELWAYLDAHRNASDADEARRLVANAPNKYDRVAAVAILGNFEADDRTWWSLISALRESDGPVQALAALTLGALRQSTPRHVEWGPATGDLHALLNGATLFFLHEVLDVLVATGADSSLARPILKNGGHAVMMFAGAAHPWARGRAHRFLRLVSGRDYGGDLRAWRAWMETL